MTKSLDAKTRYRALRCMTKHKYRMHSVASQKRTIEVAGKAKGICKKYQHWLPAQDENSVKVPNHHATTTGSTRSGTY